MDMYLKIPNLACTYLVALWEHNIHLLNTHSLLRKKILFQRSQKSIFVYKVYKVCCSSDKNTITASSRQEEDKQRDSSFLHALLSFHPFCISSSTARAHTKHARGWGWEPSADKSEQVCCGNRGTTPRLKATPLSETWAECLWDPHVPDATILSSGGLQSCHAISYQEITSGLRSAACSASCECIRRWRGQSIGAEEISLKRWELYAGLVYVTPSFTLHRLTTCLV